MPTRLARRSWHRRCRTRLGRGLAPPRRRVRRARARPARRRRGPEASCRLRRAAETLLRDRQRWCAGTIPDLRCTSRRWPPARFRGRSLGASRARARSCWDRSRSARHAPAGRSRTRRAGRAARRPADARRAAGRWCRPDRCCALRLARRSGRSRPPDRSQRSAARRRRGRRRAANHECSGPGRRPAAACRPVR